MIRLYVMLQRAARRDGAHTAQQVDPVTDEHEEEKTTTSADPVTEPAVAPSGTKKYTKF